MSSEHSMISGARRGMRVIGLAILSVLVAAIAKAALPAYQFHSLNLIDLTRLCSSPDTDVKNSAYSALLVKLSGTPPKPGGNPMENRMWKAGPEDDGVNLATRNLLSVLESEKEPFHAGLCAEALVFAAREPKGIRLVEETLRKKFEKAQNVHLKASCALALRYSCWLRGEAVPEEVLSMYKELLKVVKEGKVSSSMQSSILSDTGAMQKDGAALTTELEGLLSAASGERKKEIESALKSLHIPVTPAQRKQIIAVRLMWQ